MNLEQSLNEDRYQLALSLERGKLELATSIQGTGGSAGAVVARGSSNRKAIKALQERLNYLGYGLEVDGLFGEQTESVVKQFQDSRGAKDDGIVGLETLGKLLRAHPKKKNPSSPAIDEIEKVVLPGRPQTAKRTSGLGDAKALLVKRNPGESAQAHRQRKAASTNDPAGKGVNKGPHGGTVDPVTGKEFATKTTGPIGSTKVTTPQNTTFEQQHPRGPGGAFVQKGSTGQQTRAAQKNLNEIDRAGLKEDGIFGDHTEEKVIAFQESNGLEPDGVVGPLTKQMLKKRRTQARRHRAV
jgi:peptidoglycan hydrolase-like protein with peptidoglycan-binding domain